MDTGIKKISDDRPLYQLTVAEDSARIHKIVDEVFVKYGLNTQVTPVSTPRIKINGIRGLASYLEVSVPTAQRLKNSKKFTFYESGNKVFMYSDEVNAGLKVSAKEVGLSKKVQK